MSDLVDRGPLCAKLTKAYDETLIRESDLDVGIREGLRRAISMLANAPQVSQPEIVRCCVCQSWHDGQCDIRKINHNPYAYCSYGVRRQE